MIPLKGNNAGFDMTGTREKLNLSSSLSTENTSTHFLDGKVLKWDLAARPVPMFRRINVDYFN